jgi:hypothetical protein
MEKVAFALEVNDGWPPVGVEHVWCERTGSTYQLKNAPLFIKGLALGDSFSAEPDAVNGCIFEFTVEESSGHSLVWIIEKNGLELEPYKHELFRVGCSVEGFPAFKLHAVDVPAAAEHEAVNATMDKLESLGFAMAFPVWRHE